MTLDMNKQQNLWFFTNEFKDVVLFFHSQSLAGGSSVKAVIVDSVSAVLANMLGGKQTEGKYPVKEN